ncbi:MAG: Rrf2 family transcriptional regulator [Candidatus Krumholzibacteria bacterium]|nr:Rrf2 family transcriptional regulator [Candidatus Krumholzibacteria bacterium]
MMRISMKTDYGLIALKHIASQGNGNLINAKEIAQRFNLPPNLLAKILQSLSHSGIIEAQKGSGGGYRMSKSPGDVTLTEIFESIEGPVHMVMCTSAGGCCSVENLCTVKNGLVDLERKFAEFFDSVTLADV